MIDVFDQLDDDEITCVAFFLAEVVDTGLCAAYERLNTYRSALDLLPDSKTDMIARFAIVIDDNAAKRKRAN